MKPRMDTNRPAFAGKLRRATRECCRWMAALPATVCLCATARAGFEVDTSSKWLSVSYNGVPVIAAVDLHFTQPGSYSKAHELDAKKMRIERAGNSGRIRHKGEARHIGAYELAMDWTENRLHLQIGYELQPDARAGNAINEIYLSWPLVENARHSVDLEKQQAPVERVSLETGLGRLDWELKSSTVRPKTGAPWSRWVMRSTRYHKYRPTMCRTLAFLNVTSVEKTPAVRANGLTHRLDATLVLSPRPHLEEALLAHGLVRALARAAQRYPQAAAEFDGNADWQAFRKGLDAFAQGKENGHSQAAVSQFVSTAQRHTEAFLKRCVARGAGKEDEVVLVPQPQEMTLGNGAFVIGPDVAVLLPATLEPEELRGPNILVEELETYWGVKIPVVHADEAPAGRRCIVIGRGGQTPLIRGACAEAGVEVTAQKPGPEGYALHVTPTRIAVVGSDKPGAFYGVQSLLQLLRRDRNGRLVVPCLKVVDWPEVKMRGMWLLPGMHGKGGVTFTKQTIRRVLARYKFNTLLLGEGNSGKIRWNSHPEICDYKAAWTPEMLRECVDYAKEHFFEVIPSVQSLSHTKSIAKARPDLAEDWGCLCPSNPDLYKLLEDIYTEAIAIYKPKIFHIGLDEICKIGVCEKCRGTPPDELLVRHVTRLHDWLKARGIRTMMAHDMLLSAKEWPNSAAHSAMNASGGFSAATHPAAEKLPRDIIMDVWIYSDEDHFPALRHFRKLGFPVVASPWWRDKNNYAMTVRAHEAGALGVIGTTWMFNSHQQLSMASILPAEYAWTPGKPKFEELPYESVERIQNGMFGPRPSQRGGALRPADIGAWCNRSLRDEKAGDGSGWADEGPLHDIRLLPEGLNRFAGLPFAIIPAANNGARQCIAVAGKDLSAAGMPTEVRRIRIDDTVESLVFLQTCLLDEFKPHLHLADYVVHYADGTEKTVAIHAYRQIAPARKPPVPDNNREAWNSGYIREAARAWVGLNLAGEEIDVQAYEWVNSCPERKVASVDLRMACHDQRAAVFLLGLTAVRAEPGESLTSARR
ncbi:MAG: beta-N-acetylhexosaminidase [Kiritimatiellae bacterium]|nr:beta-N-acetylhexosaminidase [Kiritimatiellia bacterium]